ncbi:proline-rich protein 36-like [Branchiostoma floridae]|uniref:Proline-rich protein 36-like n=1 Tax=Branchiostoma floridae TaxID=7739 RepID=A0A9J7LMC5_BRAFL|nr:proline-rich protein 36-like [Branchiostoma floridae]
MPIQAVYTAKEIEQGIRSIRNADAEIPSSHEQRLAAVPAPRLSNPALLTSLPTPRLSNPPLLTSLPTPRLSNPALLTSLPTSRLSNPPLLTSLPSLRLANPPLLTSLPTPRLSNPPLLTSLPTPRLSNPPLLTSLPTPRLSNPALLTSLRKPWPSNPPPLSSLPTPQQVLQFMRQQRASMYGEAAARQESGNVQQQTSLPMPMTSPLTIQGLQKRNNNQLQAGLNDRPPPWEPPIAVGSATAWMPIQGYPSMGREAAVRQESSDARQQASLSTPKASPFTTRQKKKESNNNQPQAGQKGKPRKPPVAVKAGKTDNLGPATASTGRSSTRTAMAVPLMAPPSDMNNNTITAPATPALPAVLPDRIPLEDAIRLLVGTESKDDPSRHVHVDSPMATTAGSSTSAFPKKQGQSSPATSTGKMGQSNGSSSLNLLPTSQPTRFGDKRPKKRACIGTDTNTGKRFKPQSNLASMYNTCEPVDISDTSYNVKEDDGVDGYETPWNFGVTPNLSLSRSEGGLWHSCKPVKSLSRPPPLPPLYRPRPPGLEHVQDSPPPTSPGSPRHPSYPLRYGATGRRKPMNHYLTPYHRVGVLEHPGSPLQSTSTCPDHMVARYQNYLWIEPYDWTDSGLCDMVDASVDSAVPNKQEEGQHNDDAMDIC